MAQIKQYLFILSILGTILSCDHQTSPDTSSSPLDGTWKTIGVFERQDGDGFVNTYLFRNLTVCIAYDHYVKTSSNSWVYNDTHPTQCLGYSIDKDFLLPVDSNGFGYLPYHYSIDGKVLTLTYGYIFTGTSDSLLSSKWHFEFFDHYVGSTPAVGVMNLSFNRDGSGYLIITSSISSEYRDSIGIQYQAQDTTLHFFPKSTPVSITDSTFLFGKCAVENKKLYVNFVYNPHRLLRQ